MAEESGTEDSKDEEATRLLISHLAHRKSIGLLGAALPVLLLFYALWSGFQDTISDYHSTELGRDIFVGILFVIAFFLLAYRGHDDLDKWLARAAGALTLCVALFPNDHPHDFVRVVHFVSATAVFAVLSIFSFFLFTKTDKPKDEMGERKLKRNNAYRGCAYVMWACLAAIGLYLLAGGEETWLADLKPVFVLEGTMLWAFGISWGIKGDALLADDPNNEASPQQE